MTMPRNLSWSLFLALHGLMAAFFAVATLIALSWADDAQRESHPGLAWLAGIVYFVLTVPTAWSMYERYPGFVNALAQVATRLLLMFLMPVGMFVGATAARDGFNADPTLGWAIGGLAFSPFSIVFFLWLFGNEPLLGGGDPDYIRGTQLLPMEEAQRRALNLPCREDEPRLVWAGLSLPERFSAGHFTILGPTGSGKTVTLRLLMQSVLTRIRPGSGWRALIYDPKGEFLPLLSGMPLACPVITLHPYDRRGAAWNIGRDITDRSVALSLAATLIPTQEGQNKFFYDAAQTILSAIMEAFILLAPERWTLRDVLLVMQNREAMKRLLLSLPQTTPTYRKYFEQEQGKTLADIQATLATETTKLEPVAAMWSRANLKVSLKDWSHDSYILVLGKDKEVDEPLDNINRVLFQRISQLFTKQGSGRTWVFIDEAKFAGKIPGLDDLLTTGRSFGARVCLATQDLSGLKHAYGPDSAEELLGGAANKAILGTWNPVTSKYAAEIMGKTERIERTTSRTQAKDHSTTVSEHIVQRESVMPEEFMQVLPADNRKFFGYYSTQAVGRYCGWLFHGTALHGMGDQPRYVARGEGEQYLRMWNDADRKRLGPYLLDLLTGKEPHDTTPGPRRTHLDDVAVP